MRLLFNQIVLSQLGKPYVWGSNGPDDFDCSGLAVYALRLVGAINEDDDYSAEMLRAKCRQLAHDEAPEAGDFAFYGRNGKATHVAIFIDDTRLVSASGGDSKCKTRKDAVKRGACVKVHQCAGYRPDLIGVYKNVFLRRKVAQNV